MKLNNNYQISKSFTKRKIFRHQETGATRTTDKKANLITCIKLIKTLLNYINVAWNLYSLQF